MLYLLSLVEDCKGDGCSLSSKIIVLLSNGCYSSSCQSCQDVDTLMPIFHNAYIVIVQPLESELEPMQRNLVSC